MITTRSLCVLAASSLVATMVACTASPDEDPTQEDEAAIYAQVRDAQAQQADAAPPVVTKDAGACKQNSLGITTRAFIGPVDCNNFVRDMCTRWPASCVVKTPDWKLFCVATNAMFSENATTSTFRMSQSSSIDVECCNGAINSVKTASACVMGEERVGKVAIGKGENSGCFTSASKLGTFETMLSGHPPSQAEVGMQAMGPRACSDIWASVKGKFACDQNNVARFTEARTSASNFPSNTWRFFENGTKVKEKTQTQSGMDTLWECKDSRVAGGDKGVAIGK